MPLDCRPHAVVCSYLPLAHIYERNNMTVAVHLGGSVGFYSGNVQELLDDVLVSVCCCAARGLFCQVCAHSTGCSAHVYWGCRSVQLNVIFSLGSRSAVPKRVLSCLCGRKFQPVAAWFLTGRSTLP